MEGNEKKKLSAYYTNRIKGCSWPGYDVAMIEQPLPYDSVDGAV